MTQGGHSYHKPVKRAAKANSRADAIKKPGMIGEIGIKSRIVLTKGAGDDVGELCPGLAMLLKGVKEKGSLNKAAIGMGMAYSKAWGLLCKAEQVFGFRLLVVNGTTAGGSLLTREGAALLAIYQEVEKKVRRYAEDEYKKALRGYLSGKDG